MKKMFQKNVKKLVALGASVGAVAANAAVTVPTPDYTDVEAAATVGFGIVLTVGLLMKAKRFFR